MHGWPLESSNRHAVAGRRRNVHQKQLAQPSFGEASSALVPGGRGEAAMTACLSPILQGTSGCELQRERIGNLGASTLPEKRRDFILHCTMSSSREQELARASPRGQADMIAIASTMKVLIRKTRLWLYALCTIQIVMLLLIEAFGQWVVLSRPTSWPCNDRPDHSSGLRIISLRVLQPRVRTYHRKMSLHLRKAS